MSSDPFDIIRNYVVPDRPPIPECAWCRDEEGWPEVYHEVLPNALHFTPPAGTAQEAVFIDDKHLDLGMYAGYSSGKTTCAAAIALQNVLLLPHWWVLWVVPDFSVHEDTVLPKLIELLPERIRPESVDELRSRNTKDVVLRFDPNNGRASLVFPKMDSRILLRTYNQLQVGFEVHETIFDEIEADHNVKRQVIEQARWRTRRKIPGLPPGRSFARNRCFYFTTPNTGFVQEFFDSLPNDPETGEPTHKLHTMCAIENPWNNEPKIRFELERAKTDPLAFSLVTGVFIPHQGVIMSNFDRKTHVIPNYKMPKLSDYVGFVGGIDWATGGMSTMAPIGIIDDGGIERYYVLDEYYKRGAEWPNEIHEVLKHFAYEYPGVLKWWMDYHGEKGTGDTEYTLRHQELQEKGWDIDGKRTDQWLTGGDTDVNVRHRIGKLQGLLAPDEFGKPRLYFSDRCINIIRDFESWKWKEDRGGGFSAPLWTPQKQYKDGIDCTWYGIAGWERGATKKDRIGPNFRPRIKIPFSKTIRRRA